MKLFKFHNRMLAERPLATNMVISGILFSAGDVIAQTFFEKHEKYDFKRTGGTFVLGSVFAAPILYNWYKFLPGFCERNIYSKFSNLNMLQKTLISMSIDQTVFAFSFNCYFFMVINYIEHQSLEKGIQSIKDKQMESMIANWKLWPAAQMINFSIVPLQYRVIFANMVGLVWNVYLSWIQHRE